MPRKRIDYRTEKTIEHAGDLFMAALGFDIIRFSQTRQTRQTPGIPDRRYVSEKDGRAVWWEAKTEIGRQRDGQARFQRFCKALDEDYVLGTDDALHEWAIARGYVERLPGGFRTLRRAA